jgi:hypothetical protein
VFTWNETLLRGNAKLPVSVHLAAESPKRLGFSDCQSSGGSIAWRSTREELIDLAKAELGLTESFRSSCRRLSDEIDCIDPHSRFL